MESNDFFDFNNTPSAQSFGNNALPDPFDQLEDVASSISNKSNAPFKNWQNLQGKCYVQNVDVKDINGRMNIIFNLYSQEGKKEFNVRIPTNADAENAQYMAMQNIYNTLYNVADVDNDVSPKIAFAQAKKEIASAGDKGIPCHYSLRTWDKFSEKTGKTYTNQNLDTLERAD